MKKHRAVLILHDIRSTHNVGSIFRTADAVGISKIYITGYTPAPTDRFNRPVHEITKVALGAEKNIPWEKVSILDCIKTLKKGGFQIIAIEQDKNSVDYKKIKPKFPAAFVLGNEVGGISKDVLKLCDVVAEIPMIGGKESLNVSVAGGVALFRILNI
jgi:tRNA G18 (ribose-2'-O)-methylase SpoU